jgi:competence protein ComEC
MNFRLTRGRILAEAQAAYGYYRWCAAAADRCRAILSLGIDPAWPDLAALLRAMMLGETHELSEAQHEAFLRAGAMHLFAISGMNITVIASALTLLLIQLRLPPHVRFLLATVVVWVFVDITGGSPSAVRACRCRSSSAAALTFHQPANPLAALAATAGIGHPARGTAATIQRELRDELRDCVRLDGVRRAPRHGVAGTGGTLVPSAPSRPGPSGASGSNQLGSG